MEEARSPRELALEIALRGRENVGGTQEEKRRAEEYLASLATVDGRVALGSTFLILQDTIRQAREDGAYKLVIDAAARYAELAKLAEFSATSNETRSEQSEREARALQYLESTGVIPTGLELPEAARLSAQYIIDDILSRRENLEE